MFVRLYGNSNDFVGIIKASLAKAIHFDTCPTNLKKEKVIRIYVRVCIQHTLFTAANVVCGVIDKIEGKNVEGECVSGGGYLCGVGGDCGGDVCCVCCCGCCPVEWGWCNLVSHCCMSKSSSPNVIFTKLYAFWSCSEVS